MTQKIGSNFLQAPQHKSTIGLTITLSSHKITLYMGLFASRKLSRADWETVPVTLTPEATQLVNGILIGEGLPAGGFGGAVTALRLIDQVARDEFGPALLDRRVNPLSHLAITYLIEKGKLDLSKGNIEQAYQNHRENLG